jgi:diguanylate cyclase
MLDPLRLTDGVLVDLRSIPLTLAGAFLGLPGAVVTTLMALATRIGIGGLGMVSGSVGIVLSALIGLGWSAFVQRRPGREMRNALLLATLSLLSMLSRFLLPWDVAWQIVTTIWPVTVPLNFAGMLAVGLLLERERMMGNEARQLGLDASQDPLTGLLNRRGFEAAVRRLQVKGPGSALLVLDLDHFKHVNDTYGHAAGDVVLQTLGARLRHVLRSEDVVARFGGEEVVVFLPDVRSRAAMEAAARLCEAVRGQPFILPGGTSVAVTASVGGAWMNLIGKAGKSRLEELASQADAALYAAKGAGRNCWRLTAGERLTGSPADIGQATLQRAAST